MRARVCVCVCVCVVCLCSCGQELAPFRKHYFEILLRDAVREDVIIANPASIMRNLVAIDLYR